MWLTTRMVATVLLFVLTWDAHPAEQPGTKTQPGRVDQLGDTLPPGALTRLGTVRFRQDGQTLLLKYTSDGKKLVGYTGYGLIVWDAGTGKVLQRSLDQEYVEPGFGSSNYMDVSPDGSMFAIVPDRRASTIKDKLQLWDLTTGKQQPSPAWPARSGGIRFSPDGKSLAAPAEKGKVNLVDLATGKERSFVCEEKSGYYASTIAFSPDGKYLAAGLVESSLVLWEVATGKKIHRLASPSKLSHPIEAVAFSRDGKTVAWAAKQVIFLSDTATGKEVDRFEDKRLSDLVGLAFSPDGATLVAGTRNGGVRIWDVATAEVRFTFGNFVRSMALSPDGKTVAVADSKPALRFWNVDSGKEMFTDFPGHHTGVARLVFSPDGKALVSGGQTPGFTRAPSRFPQPIRLWDTAKWQQTRVFPGNAQTFAVSPDGKWLASGVGKTVHLIEVGAGKDTLLTITDPEKAKFPKTGDDAVVSEIVFSLDGRNILSTEGYLDSASFLNQWDTVGKKLHKRFLFPGGYGASQPHFSRDGRTFLGHRDGGVFLTDVESGRDRSPPLRKYNELFRGVFGVSPDGRMLGVGPRSRVFDGVVYLLDALTGQELALLKGHELYISALAWSADSRMAATGDARESLSSWGKKAALSIRLWDTLTGKELAKFDGLGAAVTSLALSPDGTILAAGMGDGTILIYDVSKVKPKLVARKLDKEELEGRWADLAGDNAVKAYQAAWTLIGAPAQTASLLRERLKSMPSVEGNQLKQWVSDLSSDQAAVRIAAVKQLQRVIPQAEMALRKALQETKSEEGTRHIGRLLAKLETMSPDTLRTLRAVMVLERIGTAEARGVLEALAKGAQGVRETEEAQAALARLARQPH